MHNLGHSRSASRRDHLVQTPDAFVRTTLPGIEAGEAVVHISPAAGASFTQYTVELGPGGTLAAAEGQRFVFVLDGALDLTSETSFHSLARGGYAYLPPGSRHVLRASEGGRVAVIEKLYEPHAGFAAPVLLVGAESSIEPFALLGDADLQVRRLLPDHAGMDFAVNTMTYQPGATLSQLEIHVMEHGLLMLEGSGIYRLADCWYPVAAGDFIWMARFCPQWFGALGKRPAKYLIYKDVNRHPLQQV